MFEAHTVFLFYFILLLWKNTHSYFFRVGRAVIYFLFTLRVGRNPRAHGGVSMDHSCERTCACLVQCCSITQPLQLLVVGCGHMARMPTIKKKVKFFFAVKKRCDVLSRKSQFRAISEFYANSRFRDIVEFYENDTAMKLKTCRCILQGFPWEEGIRTWGEGCLKAKSDGVFLCADEKNESPTSL